MLRVDPASLVYPGGAPGFDPSHPAAAGISPFHGFSAVATAGGGAINLLTGKPGALTGTVGGGIHGQIGPYCSFATNGKNCRTWSGNAAVADANATLACIFVLTSNGASIDTLVTSGQVNGWGLGFTASNKPALYNTGGTNRFCATIIAALNTPYFCVASSNPARAVFYLTNLLTGQITTETVVNATISAATAGVYSLGSGINGDQSNIGYCSHGMFGPNDLGAQQSFQWAADPWPFWYPK